MQALTHWILSHEILFRSTCTFTVLGLMALWEILAPRRPLRLPKRVRWFNNLTLVILNNLLVRALFPTAAVGVAAFAQSREWGVLQLYSLPLGWRILLAVVVLDLIIYLQHVMFHAIPVLWRLHRVHHADPDFDVTTGIRFHPLEILLSLGVKATAIVILGPPVAAVVLFEVLLNATAMFNHGNVGLPRPVDKVLRWLVVTPDMHRVHHSVEDDEANSNFGFNLPWWDRLLGTYRDSPREGHRGMIIGIHSLKTPRQVSWLPGMLLLPFRQPVTGYVINRRSWKKYRSKAEKR